MRCSQLYAAHLQYSMRELTLHLHLSHKSTLHSEYYFQIPRSHNRAFPTLLLSLPLLLIANTFFLCSVITTRYTKMKTATNIYIFNLALADALATSTLPFQSAKYLMNTWPFGEVLCKLIIAIDYYNMFTSIFTLTMMSVDRYIAVCHPVRALEFRTPVKAKMINVLIWVLSSAIGVPIMVMAVTKVSDTGEIVAFSSTFLSFIIN